MINIKILCRLGNCRTEARHIVSKGISRPLTPNLFDERFFIPLQDGNDVAALQKRCDLRVCDVAVPNENPEILRSKAFTIAACHGVTIIHDAGAWKSEGIAIK